MNKNQYDDKVKNIKELIELGKIREAEKEIELMKNLRPGACRIFVRKLN